MASELSSSNATGTHPARLFAVFCAVVLAAIAAYAAYSRTANPTGHETGEAAGVVDVGLVSETRQRPHVLFRVTAPGPTYGQVGIVSVETPNMRPVITGLSCDRVYASNENGLCLQADRGVFTTYRAVAFDSGLTERHSFKLPGAPSRTRVAPFASLGASTVFVSGDSYA
ncbi:MAG: hypothetical protein ACRD15_09235, partial [Vicinamibacterales bacterium]